MVFPDIFFQTMPANLTVLMETEADVLKDIMSSCYWLWSVAALATEGSDGREAVRMAARLRSVLADPLTVRVQPAAEADSKDKPHEDRA